MRNAGNMKPSKNANHTKDNIPSNCLECTKWKNHNENAILARNQYKDDVCKSKENSKQIFLSVDLQKVSFAIFKVLFFNQLYCFLGYYASQV